MRIIENPNLWDYRTHPYPKKQCFRHRLPVICRSVSLLKPAVPGGLRPAAQIGVIGFPSNKWLQATSWIHK